jgi:hypothetical protein
VTTDQRVVAKQEIQEVESAKRAGAPYAHHRGAAAGISTQTLSQEEGATTLEPLHAGERQDPMD